MTDIKSNTCLVIEVLKSERTNASNRVDLRIVKWTNSPYLTLEKRRIWEVNGEDRSMKTVGLTIEDIRFIHNNYPKIINQM